MIQGVLCSRAGKVVINIPRGFLLEVVQDEPSAVGDLVLVRYTSPHKGVVVGVVAKSDVALGEVATIVEVERMATVVAKAIVTILVSAAPSSSSPTFEAEAMRDAAIAGRLEGGAELKVLRCGPPSTTANGPGQPYAYEVETYDDDEPLRGSASKDRIDFEFVEF